MTVAIHGLEAATDRVGLIDVVRQLALLRPDAGQFLAELPPDLAAIELAQLLHELAIDIVTTGRDDDDDDDDDSDDDDRGSHVTKYAAELLRERAAAGKLDRRAIDRLLPVLADAAGRRREVVEIVGATRDRALVPGFIGILDAIGLSLDSMDKDELVAATGHHNDKPRAAAADAVATCLAAAPEPAAVDDSLLAELLRECDDRELDAETHYAYGRIARQLAGSCRVEAQRRLSETACAGHGSTARLARDAALLHASPPGSESGLAPLLREALTGLDHDHPIRNLRVALRVAHELPEEAAARQWLARHQRASGTAVDGQDKDPN